MVTNVLLVKYAMLNYGMLKKEGEEKRKEEYAISYVVVMAK